VADDWLSDTAIVTMAAGDEAGRLVVALVQSLRDVETRVPNIVVMLSRGGLGSKQCQDIAWKRERGRENVRCDSLETTAEEIIDADYVAALHKMRAEVVVIDPLPQTPYTQIPGGPQTFWGMALNKLRVFGLVRFRKLLWMDGDTLVLKNMDHLLREPMFSAAFTYDCCNAKCVARERSLRLVVRHVPLSCPPRSLGSSPAKPSGGLWVVEPSQAMADHITDLLAHPVPGTDEVW